MIVYQITNLFNNKIYIGVHSTDNLDDGYMGSGTYIKKAIKKHGKENFQFTVLHYCKTLEEAYNIEGEYVTEEFVKRRDTYNMNIGGLKPPSAKGRKLSQETIDKIMATKIKNDTLKHSEESKAKMRDGRRKGRDMSIQTTTAKLVNTGKKQNPESVEKRAKKIRGVPKSTEHKEKLRRANLGRETSEYQKQRASEANKGKVLSEETKEKMSKNNCNNNSEVRKKKANAIKGQIWLNDGKNNFKLKDPSLLEKYLAGGWVRGMLRKNREE